VDTPDLPPVGRATSLWLHVYRLAARLTQPTYTLGSITYVRRDDGAVLLVRQRLRTPSRWGLPGGFRRAGETAAEAAAREVREETGLDVDVAAEDLVVEYLQPWARHVDTLFAARYDADDQPRATSFEIADVRWFPPDDLPPLTREAVLALRHLPEPREGRGAGSGG